MPMNQHPYGIISVRDYPGYSEQAINWFASKWGIDRREYEKSFSDCISKNERLPRWYLAIGRDGEIIGGGGLIRNDSINRSDLFPYLCSLFVEEKVRGNALGAMLLRKARIDGARLGFDKLYLCTEHTTYFEKYGWQYIASGNRPGGRTVRIYEATTLNKPGLEKMDDFFTARIDMYEEHMLKGGKEDYQKLAGLVPVNSRKILDPGCGTGLELDEIFQRLPDVSIVGIDLTRVMLDKLKQKHPDKNMELICGSYFDVDLGENTFDTAVSFQTMHHFPCTEKVGLYTKIRKALNPGGVYIEGDYMVTEQAIEDVLYVESLKLRRETDVPQGEFYHIDIPCTVDNQIAMFKQAGFSSADMVYRMKNTTIIIAKK
jgi:tRNA (cmo5U34)-methyltransferase